MATPQAIMTAADLVRAVTEITQQSGQAVATGDEVYVWLALPANNIDWGGNMTPRGRHFWKADLFGVPIANG